MPLDDLTADGQPQSSALGLGRHQRLEDPDPQFFGDSWPVVFENDRIHLPYDEKAIPSQNMEFFCDAPAA
jgi:hypothetical protein